MKLKNPKRRISNQALEHRAHRLNLSLDEYLLMLQMARDLSAAGIEPLAFATQAHGCSLILFGSGARYEISVAGRLVDIGGGVRRSSQASRGLSAASNLSARVEVFGSGAPSHVLASFNDTSTESFESVRWAILRAERVPFAVLEKPEPITNKKEGVAAA